MRAIRLQDEHEPAIEELLLADPEVNLFLINMLDRGAAEASWWGTFDDDLLTAVVMVAGGLSVPYSPDSLASEMLGIALRGHHEPYMMVGPRMACDTIWAHWTERRARIRYDQRLYVADPPAPTGDDALTPATLDEVHTISDLSIAMQLEDLGTDPREHGPERHIAIVSNRIQEGRTLVLRVDGEIAFMVHVGTRHPFGCQIGGTYVPPSLRGRGIATRGVRSAVHTLLRTHPRVTLHVNESNLPAVTVYERSGFRRAAPFRLLIA